MLKIANFLPSTVVANMFVELDHGINLTQISYTQILIVFNLIIIEIRNLTYINQCKTYKKPYTNPFNSR